MASRSFSRRDFLRLSAAGGTLAMLAACQPVGTAGPGAGDSAEGAGAPAAQAVTVTYWSHDFAPRMELDKTYIDQFMEQNPGVTVAQENPGEYDTMLPTALAAGTAGDVFTHSNRFIPDYYHQEAIGPVQFEAFDMDSATFMDQYIEPQNTLAGAMFEGELYGIPNEVSIYSLHLNNALFQAEGLDPATDYPKTWEEFTDVAERLTKRDASGQLVQRGAMLTWKSANQCSNVFGGQLHQLDGSEVTDDYTKSAINSPQGEQVLTWWKYFSDNGLDSPVYTQDQSIMLQGNIAMWMNTGSWARPSLLDASIDYSVVPAPRWENNVNDNGFYVYAYFHMVNKQSDPEVQRAAWQLAAFLDSHPVEYLEKTGLLQTRKEVADSAPYKDTPFLDIFLGEISKSIYCPKPPGWRQIVDVLDRMRDSVVEGTPVQEALATAEEESNDILDEAWQALG